MMLKATGLKKSYGELAVLKEVAIEVSKGEVIAIVGSSQTTKPQRHCSFQHPRIQTS